MGVVSSSAFVMYSFHDKLRGHILILQRDGQSLIHSKQSVRSFRIFIEKSAHDFDIVSSELGFFFYAPHLISISHTQKTKQATMPPVQRVLIYIYFKFLKKQNLKCFSIHHILSEKVPTHLLPNSLQLQFLKYYFEETCFGKVNIDRKCL